MKWKNFYAEDLKAAELLIIDKEYEKNYNALLDELEIRQWTKKQKSYQNRTIVPKLALYKTFINFGYTKEESKELVRKFVIENSKKANRLLDKAFKIPKFNKLFRFAFNKTMKGDEVWEWQLKRSDDEEFAFDITKCLWKETCDFLKYPEMCELFCSADDIFFDVDKMEFIRTETLGTDGEKCDFKFKFK
ncbi:MAG: L-2-amino-thiazoline-4-carboxylic acid hydrolase [Tissierellia bacterium]|nr:L-2-amino-thiazoline-4-carboxylic acid hydrolase [Tissierellia bacterium]